MWVWGIETTTYTQNGDLYMILSSKMRRACRKLGIGKGDSYVYPNEALREAKSRQKARKRARGGKSVTGEHKVICQEIKL